MITAAPPARAVRMMLAALAWLTLVGAVGGGVGLITGDGLGLDPTLLDGTVFGSYVWPGVILAVVVGGAQALALAARWRRYRLAWGAYAAAGLTLTIWIFVQLALLGQWSPLQGVFFGVGVVQTVLAVLALGAWPRPLSARDQP